MVKKRRIVQILLIVFLIVVVLLNYYENQKLKQDFEKELKGSILLVAIDKVFGTLDKRHEILTFIQGDLWAMRIGRMRIVDPLALVGNLTRTRSLYIPMIIFAMIPILLTIIFGRYYCGWLCPMALISEGVSWIRREMLKAGIPLMNINLSKKVKYYVLGIGLLMGFIFGVHFFFGIYPPKLISYEIYSVITYSTVSNGFFTVLIILLFEILFFQRLWCRSLCPGGALFSVISKVRLVGVRNDIKTCNSCGVCDKNCPHDARPSGDFPSNECDQCGVCIDICPERCLKFGRK